MRLVNECWLQTPEVLRAEIDERVALTQTLVGTLYTRIVVAEIAKLREILADRMAELTNEAAQL